MTQSWAIDAETGLGVTLHAAATLPTAGYDRAAVLRTLTALR
ncbi:hypothetical protein [Micromonospora sagamiensis]|uniref:Uncharacterized protein n=1 Tax=Micromonospora sagamiensis TaxID=47875 RepID=A0A562WE69_9ACTN|nr:hypothetical protein [Micromonospora sagamiensis]TWJ28583.1 hypothetical protein JD81_02088 [Micromonospora sagamiensis]